MEPGQSAPAQYGVYQRLHPPVGHRHDRRHAAVGHRVGADADATASSSRAFTGIPLAGIFILALLVLKSFHLLFRTRLLFHLNL